MVTAPEPVAWLLRERRGTKDQAGRIMCGEVFMREDSAASAAERKSSDWRKVEVVPAFTEPPPAVDLPPPWRCFHCDAVFTNVAQAAAHFGTREEQAPACELKACEGGLVRAIREAEDECERVHTQLHAESADGLMAMRANLGRHRTALVAAEETGYERGLADMRKEVETLRRALAWHGDPARMATTREEWQQDVDEAIRWVKDNPEEGRPSFPSWREPPSVGSVNGLTYAVQHNPNCPSPYLVRLPRGVLDFKPEGLSTDAMGYGLTFVEAFAAAQEALAKPAPTQADVIGGLLDKARVL